MHDLVTKVAMVMEQHWLDNTAGGRAGVAAQEGIGSGRALMQV